jgi:hypothetical protein
MLTSWSWWRWYWSKAIARMRYLRKIYSRHTTSSKRSTWSNSRRCSPSNTSSPIRRVPVTISPKFSWSTYCTAEETRHTRPTSSSSWSRVLRMAVSTMDRRSCWRRLSIWLTSPASWWVTPCWRMWYSHWMKMMKFNLKNCMSYTQPTISSSKSLPSISMRLCSSQVYRNQMTRKEQAVSEAAKHTIKYQRSIWCSKSSNSWCPKII